MLVLTGGFFTEVQETARLLRSPGHVYVLSLILTLKDRNMQNLSLEKTQKTGSNGNEVVHHIPLSFRTGVSPPDDLVAYPGHSSCGGDAIPACNIGPTCCAVKKEVHRKRNTQTRR